MNLTPEYIRDPKKVFIASEVGNMILFNIHVPLLVVLQEPNGIFSLSYMDRRGFLLAVSSYTACLTEQGVLKVEDPYYGPTEKYKFKPTLEAFNDLVERHRELKTIKNQFGYASAIIFTGYCFPFAGRSPDTSQGPAQLH